MITLINTNLMRPPIAPIGLDYIATSLRAAGVDTGILDLGLTADPNAALGEYFACHSPQLVGLSFRNLDDAFWPSMQSFLPVLRRIVEQTRRLTAAPIVLGGTGFSVFPQRILEYAGGDYGIHGDGEAGMLALAQALQNKRPLQAVQGLVWPDGHQIRANEPCWPESPRIPTTRDAIDNPTYFRLGGQIGLETKRGCNRQCIFCADVLTKGAAVRMRSPIDVADEAESLLRQGIDVLHLCDAEFNIPYEHAMAVCREFIARGLGERVRWYAYLAVLPFDRPLALAMRRAGCVGINFTGPAASDTMLAAYRQPHRQQDIAETIHASRDSGITTMIDLMFGGPGETPQTVADAIGFVKGLPVDVVGAGVGVRLHPSMPITQLVTAEAPLQGNPGIRRCYDGPIDMMQPTFYISPALGCQPARLVCDCIAGDKRFFEPSDEVSSRQDNPAGHSNTEPPSAAPGGPGAATESRGYNYNDNDPLVRAIAGGARGAYWDILRNLRA